MSKAKLAEAGLAAVQVSAEWSAELLGFKVQRTKSCILPPHVPVHTPHTYIAIRHLTRRRYAGMRHLRHQHFLVALHPVCIRWAHHDLFRAHVHMYCRI
jgi:hypothetical protein